MDIDERLIELIKIRLRSALKNAEILPHAECIYVIDSNIPEWYFIIGSNGQLRFNSIFFDLTFLLFSMEQNTYSKILRDIIEKSFELPIRSTQRVRSGLQWELSIVTSKKRKEWNLNERHGFPYSIVKRYLDYKKTTNSQVWYFVELI